MILTARTLDGVGYFPFFRGVRFRRSFEVQTGRISRSVDGTIGGTFGSSFIIAVVFAVGGVVVAVATSGFDVTSIDVFFSVLFSVIFFSAFSCFFY